jgi:hypothetical protein
MHITRSIAEGIDDFLKRAFWRRSKKDGSHKRRHLLAQSPK